MKNENENVKKVMTSQEECAKKQEATRTMWAKRNARWKAWKAANGK